MFGQKIDVYMNSIGQTITEYLVNFNMVTDIMKSHPVRLATPKRLESIRVSLITPDAYMPGMGGFESILKHHPETDPQVIDFTKLLSRST